MYLWYLPMCHGHLWACRFVGFLIHVSDKSAARQKQAKRWVGIQLRYLRFLSGAVLCAVSQESRGTSESIVRQEGRVVGGRSVCLYS